MSTKNTLAIQRCELSHKELDEFLSSYSIPSEYRVILPTPTQTILGAPPGYIDEADKAFKEIKKFFQDLPTLIAPRAGETLIMYIATLKESINAALFAKISKGQIPIYFISTVLQGAGLNYPALEKLILALVHATSRLQRYFQAHMIMVLIADFLPEIPFDDSEKIVKEKEVSDPSNEWKLYTDGASSSDGAGAGLMLIDPAVRDTPSRTSYSPGNGNHESSDIPILATSGKPNKGNLRSETAVN
nr:hypothetical protein [Tanacetum cinerariifolium]